MPALIKLEIPPTNVSVIIYTDVLVIDSSTLLQRVFVNVKYTFAFETKLRNISRLQWQVVLADNNHIRYLITNMTDIKTLDIIFSWQLQDTGKDKKQ